MTKKLIMQVGLASSLALSISSCRTEDLLNSSEEKSPSKFKVFSAEKEKKIDYGKGFKTLLERYDEINNVQHTAKAFRKAFKNSLQMADEYVELNIRSQDFVTKANEKFTLFPLIKDRRVDGVIIAVLNENDTQVEFLKMYTEAENYNKILELFKEAYLKNTLQQRITAKGNGNCSSDGSPCDTGEVVITMPGTGGGIPGGIWNGGPPSGGCQPYDNCLNPEGPGGTGGGGNESTTNPEPIMPPPPDVVIPDIKKFLSCLNITQPANLRVYAARMGSSSTSGHAFISISQGSNIMTFGFYPKNGVQQQVNGPGIFGDDSGHAYTNVWNVGAISPTQLQQIIAAAIAYSTDMYNLGFHNCADFTLTALNYAGYNMSTTGIDTPNTVSNIIISNTGNNTSGNAPQTQRTCN